MRSLQRGLQNKVYKVAQKGKLLKGLGGLISAVSQILGKYGIGYGAERAAGILSERFQGMSPAWHKEHEEAFELAQNEAKQHFYRCPRCTKSVCENDGTNKKDYAHNAPRVSVEVAAAKAEKAVQDIKEKAAKTQVFTGEIGSKQTLCPQCGKPVGEGKFCNNCGAPCLGKMSEMWSKKSGWNKILR